MVDERLDHIEVAAKALGLSDIKLTFSGASIAANLNEKAVHRLVEQAAIVAADGINLANL
jgi:hypothetical protein